MVNTSKQQRYNQLYMDLAARIADMSHAVRLKVGAVIIKDTNIISYGWNGMPSGWDNNCEYIEDGELVTRPEVLHAEMNAILKLSKSTESGLGATLYLTHSPCINCAKYICQSGIKTVYYHKKYRNDHGLDLLIKSNIEIYQI